MTDARDIELRLNELERENQWLRAQLGQSDPQSLARARSFIQSLDLCKILDHMPSMIGYWDKSLINRYVNQAYLDRFGLLPEQVIGQHMRQVVGEERYRLNLPFIEGVLRGEPQEFEREIPSPDGIIRYSLARYIPDVVDGEVQGFFVEVSNVTTIVQGAAEIRERAEILDGLYSLSPLGIALTDPNGKFIEFNEAFERITGYDTEELRHRDFWEMTSPDYQGQDILQLDALRQTGRYGPYEKQLKRKDGSLVPVRLSGFQLVREGVNHTWSLIEDISDRVKDTASIQSLSQRYQLLFDELPDSVVLIDVSGKVIGCNQSALREYGYSESEMLALYIPDFEAKEDPARVEQHKRQILKSGRDRFITQHRKRDGSILDIDASVVIVELPDGKPIFQCVFRDITERKQWEINLLQVEERLELALESAEAGTWDWDIVTGELITSLQWSAMLGYQPGELAHDISVWEPLCHPDDLPEAQRLLEAHFKGELPSYEYEHRLRHKSGEWIWVLGKAKVVKRDVDGKALRIIGININITPRKLAELSLQRESQKNVALLKAASDGLHILDSRGTLIQASDSFCRLLGYSADELSGANVLSWDVELGSLEDFTSKVNRLPVDGATFETRQRRKSGEIIDAEISAVRLVIDGQQMIYCSAQDITLRKQTESRLRDREAKLRAILDNMPYMVWLKDMAGRYVAANRLFVEAAGKSSLDELIGKVDTEIWSPALANRYHLDDMEVIATRKQLTLEVHSVDRGTDIWYEAFKAPIINEAGELIGTTGVARDITERKRIDESLKIASMVYQASSEAMLVTDADNNILNVNPAFTKISGYTLEEVKGKNPRIFQSGRHDQEFYHAMWSALNDHGYWFGEVWDKRKNGEVYAKQLTINTIRDKAGKISRHIALFSDITEKKKNEQIIWSQANIDPLTQLPNRRLFIDRLEQDIRKVHRSGQTLALFFIDLDRFKQINDSLGHQAGDQLLIEAARRISQCVRGSDTVARLGGDEFTVILPNLSERAHVERVASTILGRLAEPFELGSDSAYVSASIGITIYPTDTETVDGLLKCADQAMYAAKDRGRNAYSYFTQSMQELVIERQSMSNDLRLALARNELEVYFQPIVELATGRTLKAEALLRWKHPRLGMVSPVVFIPLAEETGMIHSIGSWVFKQAISAANRIRMELGIELQFSRHPEEIDWMTYLADQKMAGGMVAVEITEGLWLNSDAAVQDRLHQFSDTGVQVSIDDFGTGFSSLAYIKKFDIDYLKIDQSFVRNLDQDNSDLALTEAIIAMAHKLGIKTIAEGVETVAQLDVLKACGCDFAQGYYFANPMPEADFKRWLQDRPK